MGLPESPDSPRSGSWQQLAWGYVVALDWQARGRHNWAWGRLFAFFLFR